MVRLYGQADRSRRCRRATRCAHRALERHRRDQILSRRRAEPPARHDRRAPRLGALAPARLGRADHRLRQQARRGEILKDELVNHRIAQAFEEEGADAWFTDTAAPALPRRSATMPTTTRWSPTSSTSGSIPARPMPSCWSKRARNGPPHAKSAAPRCISKARTSIAAGSIPRCSKAAPPTAARPMTAS